MVRTTERAFSQRFGKAVRLERERQGLTQEKLAEFAEVDRTFIVAVERGTKRPSLESANQIARALDVKLSTLIKRAERLTVIR